MPIRSYKPTSPARRGASVDTFADVTAFKPYKKLTIAKKRTGGRNFSGKITVRHHGGGAKQRIRLIDFVQNRYDAPAVVETIEYDPGRNARIALIKYPDGEHRYIVAPVELKVGDLVFSSLERTEIRAGSRMPLKDIPVGMSIYGIELSPGRGATLVRSAGGSAKLMAVEGGYATVRMPSSEVRLVPELCRASIGQVSNPDAMHVRLGKAGRMRHRGVRPSVRGKVMNPVDHPHGGGEGVNPIGLKAPKTYTGKKALGVRTRRRKKYSNALILQRRKK
jgi:large subunit ribosomal protein L2